MFDLINEPVPLLAPGEKVLWQGHNTKLELTCSEWATIILVMLLVLVPGYAIVFVWKPGPPLESGLGLLGRVLLALGLLMVGGILPVLGLIWGDDPSERNVRYLVTNRSAIIAWQGRRSSKRLITIPFENAWGVPMRVIDNRDGTGTISFRGLGGKIVSREATHIKPVFRNIENPREVYRLICEQVDKVNSLQTRSTL